MKRARSRLRGAAVLVWAASAAGLLLFAVTAPASAQAVPETVVEQPFSADSGDSCQYGYAKGVLGWRLGPIAGQPTAVDVSGTLLDRPLSTVVEPGCGEDGRFSIVTLSAYAGSVQVDTESVRVDNGTREFRSQLTNETSTAPIARVVVQVCRQSLVAGPFDYCGTRQEYRAPVS